MRRSHASPPPLRRDPVGATRVESLTGLDAVVDRTPVGQPTEAAVIEEEIGLELAREARPPYASSSGKVSIDSVELHTTLAAPLHGFVQQSTLTDSPEDETMPITDQHREGLGGEGDLFADLGITVTHDRAVKVNSYNHQ